MNPLGLCLCGREKTKSALHGEDIILQLMKTKTRSSLSIPYHTSMPLSRWFTVTGKCRNSLTLCCLDYEFKQLHTEQKSPAPLLTQLRQVNTAGQPYNSSPADNSTDVLHRASQAVCCLLLNLVKTRT